MSGRLRAGFSLIEVLAVVLLTSVVIAVALNHYVDLSRATQRAGEHTRDVRRAVAILDRIARDFESTVFVLPDPGADDLGHPWVFLGESRRSDLGADHLKFVTRGRQIRGGDVHESDLELVAYGLRRSEDDLFELMRWSSPQLPESYDDRIPTDESEGAMLLAEELAGFGVKFIDEAGGETDEWNASQLRDAGQLPAAVRIQVALADADAEFGDDPQLYSRHVLLQVAPFDLEELLDPTSLASGGSGSESDEEGGEDGDDEKDKFVDQECVESPCAGMSTCQAINCSGNLGRFGGSADTMLRYEIANPRPFCEWRFSIGRSNLVNQVVSDPACR